MPTAEDLRSMLQEYRRRQEVWRERRRRQVSKRKLLLRRLRALADERRLIVLELLRDGDQGICDMQETLLVSEPLLSYHLKVLRQVGLVDGWRDGRHVRFTLKREVLAEVREHLGEIAGADGRRPAPADLPAQPSSELPGPAAL